MNTAHKIKHENNKQIKETFKYIYIKMLFRNIGKIVVYAVAFDLTAFLSSVFIKCVPEQHTHVASFPIQKWRVFSHYFLVLMLLGRYVFSFIFHKFSIILRYVSSPCSFSRPITAKSFIVNRYWVIILRSYS